MAAFNPFDDLGAPVMAPPVSPGGRSVPVLTVRGRDSEDGRARAQPPAPKPAAFNPFDDLGAPVANEPAKRELKPGQKGGLAPNVTAGAVQGFAGGLDALADPVGYAGKMALTLGLAGYDALAPVFGYQPSSNDFRRFILDEQVEGPGTRAANAFGRAIGAPALSDVVAEPESPEAMARAVAAGAAGVGAMTVAPGAVRAATGVLPKVLAALGQPAAGAAIGGVGGAVGQAAEEAAPERYKEAAGLLGNLIGGKGAAVITGGAEVLARAARRNVLDPIGIGRREVLPFTNPATDEPIIATRGQQRLAGEQIRDAAGGAVPPPQTGELVEGSQPTLGQETGDYGLLALERRLRTQNQVPFNAQEARNQVARVKALNGLAGPEEAAGEAGRFFGEQRARLEAFHTALEDAARAAAEGRAEGLPGESGVSAQDLGEGRRAALEALRKPVRQAATRLYDAVDPDGTLAVGARSIADVAKAIIARVNERMGGEFGPEKNLLERAAGARPVELFSDLRDLDSAASEVQRAILGDLKLGAESRAAARVKEVRNAIARAMDDAVTAAAKADPEVGRRLAAEMPQQVGAPGTSDAVFTPSGERVGVRYVLREAGDLVTSHNDDMTPNPAFPAELQPRDRERTASALQADRIVRNPNPEQLGGSSSLNEGAPIVGPDGVVDNGNIRAIALRRIYAENGEGAQRYRDWLTSQGYDITGMKAPVLVRERTSPMTPEERVRFAQEGAVPTGLALSATEKAGIDAGRITPDMLNLLRPGEITSAGNREFARAFIHGVTEPSEHNALFTERNGLSVEGAQRIRSALVQRAFGDRNLVASLAEIGDENTRALGTALSDVAPAYARLRGQIESGRVDASVDIAPALLEAVRLVRKARTEGISLADAVGQPDMFGAARPELTEALLRAAYGDNLAGRLSGREFREVLHFYAEEAEKQTTGERLFGGAVPPGEILRQGVARGRSGAGGAGAGAGEGRGEAGQAGAGPAGQGTSTGLGVEAGASQADLTQAPLVANLDAENVQALRAANRFYAEYKDTFRRGAVGEVLRSAAGGNGFKLADSAVPGKLFRKGPAGAEAADSLIKAAGSPEAAVQLLGDYPAFSFRQAAVRDGVVVPRLADKWIAAHQAALGKLPGLREAFADAAAATRELERASAEGQAALQAYQQSAAGRYLTKTGEVVDTRAAMQSLLRSPTALADAQDLMARAAGDQAAIDGLRSDVVRHIIEQTKSVTEAGTTRVDEIKGGTFIKMMENDRNAAVFRTILGDADFQRLLNMAEDIGRAARAVNAVRIPGSPGTAADWFGLKKHLGSSSQIMGQLVIAEALGGMIEAGVLHGITGLTGTGLAGASMAVNALRLAGLRSVDALATQGVLNPELGRFLEMRANLDKEPSLRARLLQRIGAVGVSAATRKTERKEEDR